MSDPTGELTLFAYGEDVESVSLRSLGYRLLEPRRGESWCAEIEALARQLQATPYSDYWPAADLFCSVLLADGRRAIALTRYGLADRTPSQRRGGLELLGVIAPAGLDVEAALSIYHVLRQRRADCEDLHQFGGRLSLDEMNAPPPPMHADPIPVLPVRLWQEGALLFAASSPADPDRGLRLLEQGAGSSWQWLPLVGPDFPLQTYAQRGPLIAWTPHLAGVALKLDRKTSEIPAIRPARSAGIPRLALAILLLLLMTLVSANLWSTVALHRAVTSAPTKRDIPAPLKDNPATPPDHQERFLAALRQLLIERGGRREWEADKSALLARYERLARTHRDLQVRDNDISGKLTLAIVSELAERSGERIEAEVRKALSGKGFSDRLIKAACEHVGEQFARKP